MIVTDADCKALEAVEQASKNLGLRCISLTGCRHPGDARWTPAEVEELILSTPHDPVVVLVDDEGRSGEGWGERVIRHLATSPKVKVMGVVAVASDMTGGRGAAVAASIDARGERTPSGVNKEGAVERSCERRVYGDTVENLDELGIPVVIGIGDPGKMNFADDAKSGAPITTKALAEILHAYTLG